MAPLVLEGATLGERHQHYNKILKEAISTAKVAPAKIDYRKTDIENLFNIDLASNNKDVEYILDVLKGEDLFYVKRAIKRSSWLITDDQFAHIIDPEYLHSHLFPQMMPKASSQLLLHIRLTLKNESRVEKFFQYFRNKNLETALKWLPNCPVSVIKHAVDKHIDAISPGLFSRLCLRTHTVLEIFSKTDCGRKVNELKAAMILLRSNPGKYLDTVNELESHCIPDFSKKNTEIVMKKFPQRFIDNFDKFMGKIHLATFSKYLKKEDIKTFLLKQLENGEVRWMFDADTVDIFMRNMPQKVRLELIKTLIERKSDKNDDEFCVQLCSVIDSDGGTSNAGTYRWYKHAPFNVAFTGLTKIIRSESNPDERNAILNILVNSARRKLANIDTLLQYYRERHINEQFRFKVQFVNNLLQKTHPHLYSDAIWKNLDIIFRSMEVYTESQNDVQACLQCIIVYKVTHEDPVPAVVEEKFNFSSLKSFCKNMNEEKKAKVFNYLYNLLLNKLNEHKITNNAELAQYVGLLQQGLLLLKDWNKELENYPLLISKITNCVQIKQRNGWSTSLASLYDTNKSWKKVLFEQSLILSPSENVCMNALKHDPELLVRHKAAVEALCCDDAVRMRRVLGKLRVYWPQSAAREWAAAYRARLQQPAGHAALVRGLCTLLDRQELLQFLREYEPQETKINWTDTDELKLSLRKNIGQNMHLARPQVTPDIVLRFAKGDYVQYTQPSLNAILYNLRPSHSRECVLNLLNGTTLLQKHGVHLAFAKLAPSEIKQIFLEVWKSNKKSSVRAMLFQNTHELLCKEKDVLEIADLWKMMQMFIDSLTSKENKTVYNILGKMDKVHSSIKAAYCMKSYNFIKSLPPKANFKNLLLNLKGVIYDLIEELDSDFVANIVMDFLNEILSKKCSLQFYREMQILTSFILRVDDESVQLQRYEKVIEPYLEKSITSWDDVHRNYCVFKQNMQNIIEELFRESSDFAFNKNKIPPSTLFRNILSKLEGSLETTRNYILFTELKLAIAFVDSLQKTKTKEKISIQDDLGMQKLHLANISDFGNTVIQYMKEDVCLYTPLIYTQFAIALEQLMDTFNVSLSIQLKYFLKFLGEKDFVPIYLLVIKLMRLYCEETDKADFEQVRDLILSHGSCHVEICYYTKFIDFDFD